MSISSAAWGMRSSAVPLPLGKQDYNQHAKSDPIRCRITALLRYKGRSAITGVRYPHDVASQVIDLVRPIGNPPARGVPLHP
jgi:hypothetical protein